MEASCLCGEVRIRISGRLGPVVCCHCTMCQKASGTAFGANADVRAEDWVVTQGADGIREYVSSPGVHRGFCGRCGSPLYKRREDTPGVYRVRLGSLDADPEQRPLAHFFTGVKAPWFEIEDSLPRFAGSPAEHAAELRETFRDPHD